MNLEKTLKRPCHATSLVTEFEIEGGFKRLYKVHTTGVLPLAADVPALAMVGRGPLVSALGVES